MVPQIPREDLVSLVRTHGSNSLSTSTIQPGMNYFVIGGVGFISYRKKGLSTIVLSDPVVGSENLDQLISAFLDQHPSSCFFYVGQGTAGVLDRNGFFVNEMGIETFIDLPTYSLSGGDKESLRASHHRAQRNGIVIKEYSLDEVDPERIKQISDDWRKQKVSSAHEFSFLARSMDIEDEKRSPFTDDTRYFFAEKNGSIVGFIVFDPLYHNGQVIGYAANILRSHLDGNISVLDAIMYRAIESFKSEKRDILSLAQSPCYRVDDKGEYNHSRLFTWTAQYFFQHWNHVFEFKTLAGHKAEYGGREEKIYFASKRKVLSQIEVADVYALTGIDTVGQLVHGLREKGIAPFPRFFSELARNKFFIGDPAPRIVLIDDNDHTRKEIADQLWSRYRVVEYGAGRYGNTSGAMRELTHDTLAFVVRGDSGRIKAGKAANGLRMLSEQREPILLIVYGNLEKPEEEYRRLQNLRSARGARSFSFVAGTNPKDIYFEVGVATAPFMRK